MKPRIFISCASSELKGARQIVANALTQMGYEPIWQEIFNTGSGDLLSMLEGTVRSCRGLIQIVGVAYGSEPDSPTQQFGRVSYTQYEFLYAQTLSLETWLIKAEPDVTRDKPSSELDRPSGPHPDPQGYQQERRLLQEAYLKRFSTHLRHQAKNDTELENKVLRLRNELSKFQEEEKKSRRHQLHLICLVLALLAILGAGGWVLSRKIGSDSAKAAQESSAANAHLTYVLGDPDVLKVKLTKHLREQEEKKIAALRDKPNSAGEINEIIRQTEVSIASLDDLIERVGRDLAEDAHPAYAEAARILEQEGVEPAIKYLKLRRHELLEKAKGKKAQQDQLEKEKRQLLKPLDLESSLLETNLEWKEALALREEIAVVAPEWWRARIGLGTIYRNLASWDHATRELEAAEGMAASGEEKGTSANELGLLYADTNQPQKAETSLRDALANRKSLYGDKSPQAAQALHNLGVFLQEANQYKEAEKCLMEALEIDEATCGPSAPATANALNSVGLFFSQTDRPQEAEVYYRRALGIYEETHNEDRPECTPVLHNLAYILKESGEEGLLVEAERLFRKSVAVQERSYGPKHPNVARCLNSLALFLKERERYDEAETHYRRALEIDEKSYGPHHPLVAHRVNNIGLLLMASDRKDEAESYLQRGLEIFERNGPDSQREYAGALNNLASLFELTGRLDQAEPLSRRQAAIILNFKVRTGHFNPNTLAALGNYSRILDAMKLPSSEIREKLHGLGAEAAWDAGEWERYFSNLIKEEPALIPNIAWQKSCDAYDRFQEGRLREATELWQAALDLHAADPLNRPISKEVVRVNLAATHLSLGKAQLACDEFQAIAGTCEPDSWEAGRCHHQLALCYQELSNKAKAAEEAREAIRIYEQLPPDKDNGSRNFLKDCRALLREVTR